MSPLLRLTAVAAFASTLPFFSESTADACSVAFCWGPQAYSVPSARTIPDNAGAIPVWFRRGYDSLAEAQRRISLTQKRMDSLAPVAFRLTEAKDTYGLVLLTPEDGFRAGQRYDLAVTTSCDEDAPAVTTTFAAGSTAPPPDALGHLRVGASRRRELQVTHDAMCMQAIDAETVAIALRLDESAYPWAALFVYETWVDGERYESSASVSDAPHPGGSWVGRGKDLLYTTCNTEEPVQYPGLAAGTHTVVMRATIPGTDVFVETPAAQVTLACDAAQ